MGTRRDHHHSASLISDAVPTCADGAPVTRLELDALDRDDTTDDNDPFAGDTLELYVDQSPSAGW